MTTTISKRVRGTLLASVFPATPLLAEAGHVYNRSDYIDEELSGQFEVETKLLAGSTGYGVVAPSGRFLSRRISAGAFQKLDMSKLPNLVNVWKDVEVQTPIYRSAGHPEHEWRGLYRVRSHQSSDHGSAVNPEAKMGHIPA